MDALARPFGLTISGGPQPLTLREGRHFRMAPTSSHVGFGNKLSKRQIDLLRIATAVHIADGWVRRFRKDNGHRRPVVEVEVLDIGFWTRPESYARLKACVDFVSGGDDWNFRFVPSAVTRHDHLPDMFRGLDLDTVVTLYSGGLDSAAGLAIRLAAVRGSGRMVIPVTVRHQMQKGQLVRGHFELMTRQGLVGPCDLKPFQAGAFVKNEALKSDFGVRLREISHRCRPVLFMAVAGLVADSVTSARVEVFESGVGSVNLPLVSGPPDYRTTRSTHPRHLRLMSDLVSLVNGSGMEYVLPFAHLTKGEMAARLTGLGLQELARRSVSCIMHPLRRPSGRQCGHCPACVYRRQALFAAGIEEPRDAYDVDLFDPFEAPAEEHLAAIRAFRQQVGRLAELDAVPVPAFFRRHLYGTRAATTAVELGAYVELHRRYRREWETLIADARRRGLAWVSPSQTLAYA